MEDQLEDEVRKRKRENEQREDLEKNKQVSLKKTLQKSNVNI